MASLLQIVIAIPVLPSCTEVTLVEGEGDLSDYVKDSDVIVHTPHLSQSFILI